MNKEISPAPQDVLASLEQLFFIDQKELEEVIADFQGEMRLGLAGKKSSLKMIPSFVKRPAGTEKGDFLAVDLGGTNIRVLAVRLDGNRHATLIAAHRFAIPTKLTGGTGARLFDFIAGCIGQFFAQHQIDRQHYHDLAFTFSFPVEQIAVASGRLISWTKGFSVTGVEGRDVAALLREALARNQMGFLNIVALTNDTVGTLAAQSYADPAGDIGVILGTGTNACYPEKGKNIKKLPGLDPAGEIIINIEWGNFNKLKTNIYDRLLDRASNNRQQQQLEKMVSGMYLGELARLIIVRMIKQRLLFTDKKVPEVFQKKYALTAEKMAQIAQGNPSRVGLGPQNASPADVLAIREICRIVILRAGRLAGGLIAAVIRWMDNDLASSHTVAVDGSLFEKYPGFRDSVTATLQEILGARSSKIRLKTIKDGSGIGAAIVGAVASLNITRRQP